MEKNPDILISFFPFRGAALAVVGAVSYLPAGISPGRSYYALGGDPDVRQGKDAGRTQEANSVQDTDSGKASSATEEGEPRKPKRPSWMERYVAQVLSGNILTRAEVRRMYPYVLFIAVLMFLYIANGYHIQKLHRRHDRLTEQIKELRSRSLTISSIRMTATRQSEIIKELEVRGIPLEESLTPPKIIEK